MEKQNDSQVRQNKEAHFDTHNFESSLPKKVHDKMRVQAETILANSWDFSNLLHFG